MSTSRGKGNFVSWDGGFLFIGRATGIVPMHAHYAMQIAFGAKWGIRFRSSDADPWTEYGGVIIPSRQPHAMDASHVEGNVVLFVEPETREGRALSERFQLRGITELPGDLLATEGQALFSAWREERSVASIAAAARRLVHVVTGGVEPSVTSDERILRAVSHINTRIDGALTLEEVAEVACLSPSRFRHLFVEQTGMALRPYILWRRFVRVWELIEGGATLSHAAHAAGFADAAHLSRTSTRMFGFPPSALQLTDGLRSGVAEGAVPVHGQQREGEPAGGQPLRSIGGGAGGVRFTPR